MVENLSISIGKGEKVNRKLKFLSNFHERRPFYRRLGVDAFGSGQNGDPNTRGPVTQQESRDFVGRRARRQDVVDQENSFSGNPIGSSESEGVPKVFLPIVGRKQVLQLRRAGSPQDSHVHRAAKAAAQFRGDEIRRVHAALPGAASVHRHRENQIGGDFLKVRPAQLGQKARRRGGQEAASVGFHTQDELTEFLFVFAQGHDPVKTEGRRAAAGTALFVFGTLETATTAAQTKTIRRRGQRVGAVRTEEGVVCAQILTEGADRRAAEIQDASQEASR